MIYREPFLPVNVPLLGLIQQGWLYEWFTRNIVQVWLNHDQIYVGNDVGSVFHCSIHQLGIIKCTMVQEDVIPAECPATQYFAMMLFEKGGTQNIVVYSYSTVLICQWRALIKFVADRSQKNMPTLIHGSEQKRVKSQMNEAERSFYATMVIPLEPPEAMRISEIPTNKPTTVRHDLSDGPHRKHADVSADETIVMPLSPPKEKKVMAVDRMIFRGTSESGSYSQLNEFKPVTSELVQSNQQSDGGKLLGNGSFSATLSADVLPPPVECGDVLHHDFKNCGEGKAGVGVCGATAGETGWLRSIARSICWNRALTLAIFVGTLLTAM